MHWLISISALLVLSSCTISINQVHSAGEASDIIDEDQKAEAQVSPIFRLPMLGYDYDMGGRDIGLCHC